MKRLGLLAVAGLLLAAPAFVAPANAMPISQLNSAQSQLAGVTLARSSTVVVRRSPPRRYRHRHPRRPICTSTVVYRHGRRVVIRRCR